MLNAAGTQAPPRDERPAEAAVALRDWDAAEGRARRRGRRRAVFRVGVATMLLVALALPVAVPWWDALRANGEQSATPLYRVAPGSIRLRVQAVGTLAAARPANLAPGSAGRVAEVFVGPGDSVCAG